MTEIEIQSFIENVLIGFWSDWKPTDQEYSLWAYKLKLYNYNRAEKALQDWLSEQDYQGKAPKIGKILKALGARGALEIVKRREPIKAFEIYQEENPQKRYPFYVKSHAEFQKRKIESFENEAEKRRTGLISMFGGNWIIIQDWKAYYETIEEPTEQVVEEIPF